MAIRVVRLRVGWLKIDLRLLLEISLAQNHSPKPGCCTMNFRAAAHPADRADDALTAVVSGVLFLEGGPLLGQVVARIDGRNRADGDAGSAVDALDGIDEKLVALAVAALVLLGVDAVHRAGIHTGRILRADARFCDYIRHVSNLPYVVRVTRNLS